MILPAISIRQPWPFAILNLGKDIENRSWDIPIKYLNTPVLMHAGKGVDQEAVAYLRIVCGFDVPKEFPTGGIVGMLVFEGQNNYRAAYSKWADPGFKRWAIERSVVVPFHPCKGQLGFFAVDYPFEIKGAVGS